MSIAEELDDNALSKPLQTQLTPNSSKNPLRDTLAKLTHLDLAGKVTYNSSTPQASGGYCDVFRGEYLVDSSKAAVRRLRIHAQGSQDFAKQIAKEMNIWSKLTHPNILPLLGYIIEDDLPCLVSPWMDNGTVLRYLANNPEHDEAIRMIIGVASGLEYLHNLDIIHSDIKADNVPLSSDGQPLICDFGISRRISTTYAALGGTTTGAVKGSLRWMSPETLNPHDAELNPGSSKEADVWAFGMFVYEVLTHKLPFYQFMADGQVMLAIYKGLLPLRDHFDRLPPQLQAIWSLCCDELTCWNKDPRQRPTMQNILVDLEPYSSLNIGPFKHKHHIRPSINPLRDILAKLTHLDLSGKVNYDRYRPRGGGGFSDVYLGEYVDDSSSFRVAVKISRVVIHSYDVSAKYTANEMDVWSKLEHPNILRLWGYVLEGDGLPWLVSAWMDNGTLPQYLKRNLGIDIIRLILGIAYGLKYLHELDIIHSDIRSTNVLVSPDGQPLIFDFGLSRRISTTHNVLRGPTTSAIKGTLRWLSPEILDLDRAESIPGNTKEADVWAFGMLVYEVLTQKLPFYHLENEYKIIFAILEGQLPSFYDFHQLTPRLKAIWTLCCNEQTCWNKDPKQRPTMREVLSSLERCYLAQGPIQTENRA